VLHFGRLGAEGLHEMFLTNKKLVDRCRWCHFSLCSGDLSDRFGGVFEHLGTFQNGAHINTVRKTPD
jgi:hypothetical protein